MDGDLNQEYITTHKGPSYCVSVGGLDEAQLTNSRTADQFTIQPVMAIREKVPQKSTTTTVTDSSSGNDNGPSQESTNQASLTIYKSHAGQWGTSVREVIKSYNWIPEDSVNDLSLSSKAGIYFLTTNSGGSFYWLKKDAQKNVKCPTSRGLLYVKNDLTDIVEQLYSIIEFFDKSQEPPPTNETILDTTFFSCRPALRSLPRVLLLAVHDAMTFLRVSKVNCSNLKLLQLLDAVEFLSKKKSFKHKDKSQKIKPLASRSRRSFPWDLIGPEEDYSARYETRNNLRDNVLYNHNEIDEHSMRMKSFIHRSMTSETSSNPLSSQYNSSPAGMMCRGTRMEI